MKKFFMRVVRKLRSYTAPLFKKRKIKLMRERNSVSHISVISSNCIGCLLLHDLGLRFESPTVNLFFSASDFVKFVKRLDYYLTFVPDKFEISNGGYPVGYIDDIRLDFVHYKTKEECIELWERRKKRVDLNNMVLIFTDRNGLTPELLKEYLDLPYKKIVYVSKKSMCLSDECIYVPGFENEKSVGEMDKYADWTGHRYYEKYFDIVGWLNGR